MLKASDRYPGASPQATMSIAVGEKTDRRIWTMSVTLDPLGQRPCST
ncbi:MAG: hypothetical protein ACK5GD_06875 [Planctomycetota bacterium]